MVLLVSISLDLLSICFYVLPFPGSCLLSTSLLVLVCSSVVPGSLVVRYLVVMLLGYIYGIVRLCFQVVGILTGSGVTHSVLMLGHPIL
jgi:hypothetical protein